MKDSLDTVKELLEHLQGFSKDKGREPNDIEEFVIWLNEQLFNHSHSSESAHDSDHHDMELTFLLIMQNKHYKTYCKKALHDSEINSPDEYSFLYHLTHVESFRKMELINIHLLEAPSGIEVIKRLLKKELIEEFADKDDKRAKRVRISVKGEQELSKTSPIMKEVFAKMSAEMTLKEKLHVISFLNKFNDYHLGQTK